MSEELVRRLHDAIYECLLVVEQTELKSVSEGELAAAAEAAEQLLARLNRLDEDLGADHPARTVTP
ncbi:MAG: hypothetical protein ABI640_13090 [Gammaproteobacteria bacterium]